MAKDSQRKVTDYKLLFHDTADQIFRCKWPPTPKRFIEAYIEPYKGSAIDAYCFCTNIAGTSMFYDTKVGEMCHQSTTVFRGSSALRFYEYIKQLCTTGNAPPKLAVEYARRLGMDCFLRLRMNDIHDRLHLTHNLDKPSKLPKTWTAEPCYHLSKFKREHPELLLGDPWAANLTGNSYEAFESMAYNYGLGEVRKMYYKLAEEIVTRFKPDGLQLDFLRFPFFFSKHESYAQRHLLTDLVRRIRKRVNECAKDSGRRIYLIADIPDTIESALRAGIDTPAWLKEGLLDMVTISRGYTPFSSPWEEVNSLAKKAGVPAFACFNYGKTFSAEDAGQDTGEMRQKALRGAVYRALSSGVHGVFLFNYFYESTVYDQWPHGRKTLSFDFTRELKEKQELARMGKIYCLDRGFETVPVGYAHSHTAWKGQVPLTIGTGERHCVTFDIPEEPHADGAILWLQLIDPHFDDTIEFRWNNGRIIPDTSAWHGLRLFDQFEYNFALKKRQLRKGENKLEIHLKSRERRLEQFITLKQGYLTVNVE